MPQITKETILDIINKVIEDDIDVQSLDPAIDLKDQDIDSLDMINILFELQDAYGIEIPEESIENGDWLTIEKIVTNLNRMLGS